MKYCRFYRQWHYFSVEAATSGRWAEMQFTASTHIDFNPNVVLDKPEELEGKASIEQCRRCKFWWMIDIGLLWFRAGITLHI